MNDVKLIYFVTVIHHKIKMLLSKFVFLGGTILTMIIIGICFLNAWQYWSGFTTNSKIEIKQWMKDNASAENSRNLHHRYYLELRFEWHFCQVLNSFYCKSLRNNCEFVKVIKSNCNFNWDGNLTLFFNNISSIFLFAGSDSQNKKRKILLFHKRIWISSENTKTQFFRKISYQ